MRGQTARWPRTEIGAGKASRQVRIMEGSGDQHYLEWGPGAFRRVAITG